MTAKINKFLNHFGTVYKDTSNIQLCVSIDNVRNSRMKNVASIQEALAMNKNGSDVYFYINRGGTKQNQITYLTSCFVDLDAGRDASGKYLPLKRVLQKKSLMIEKISSLADINLYPNAIVETRNGYHLYWFLRDEKSRNAACPSVTHIESWKIIQSKICNLLKDVGADSRAQKVNQIFRVPYTLWNKKHEGCKDTFETTVFGDITNTKYTLKQLGGLLKNIDVIKTKSPSQSFRKDIPKSFAVNKLTPSECVVSNDYTTNRSELLTEAVEFLNEVSTILNYSNHKFLGKQAAKIAQKLLTEITLC